ncbi:MAG: XRE family transcriptional regulator [Polaromonas sp.]|nr:MAG: XRE family transcriptional regulator [Polaromonas sp.]
MLNEALRLIRAYHDLTQTQLSYELGVSNSFLSEIESGKKIPSLDLLGKYSTRFDIPVSSMLFFSENLEKSRTTDNLRLGVARKAIELLDWVSKTSKRSVTGV